MISRRDCTLHPYGRQPKDGHGDVKGCRITWDPRVDAATDRSAAQRPDGETTSRSERSSFLWNCTYYYYLFVCFLHRWVNYKKCLSFTYQSSRYVPTFVKKRCASGTTTYAIGTDKDKEYSATNHSHHRAIIVNTNLSWVAPPWATQVSSGA